MNSILSMMKLNTTWCLGAPTIEVQIHQVAGPEVHLLHGEKGMVYQAALQTGHAFLEGPSSYPR